MESEGHPATKPEKTYSTASSLLRRRHCYWWYFGATVAKREGVVGDFFGEHSSAETCACDDGAVRGY